MKDKDSYHGDPVGSALAYQHLSEQAEWARLPEPLLMSIATVLGDRRDAELTAISDLAKRYDLLRDDYVESVHNGDLGTKDAVVMLAVKWQRQATAVMGSYVETLEEGLKTDAREMYKISLLFEPMLGLTFAQLAVLSANFEQDRSQARDYCLKGLEAHERLLKQNREDVSFLLWGFFEEPVARNIQMLLQDLDEEKPLIGVRA